MRLKRFFLRVLPRHAKGIAITFFWLFLLIVFSTIFVSTAAY